MQTVKYVYWQEDDAWLGFSSAASRIDHRMRITRSCEVPRCSTSIPTTSTYTFSQVCQCLLAGDSPEPISDS